MAENTVSFSYITNTGLVREHNEDNVGFLGKSLPEEHGSMFRAVTEEVPLSACAAAGVFDGMGGDAAFAVYPSSIVSTYDGTDFKVTVPSAQDGTFANAAIEVAPVSGASLSFKNLGGLLKFEITDAAVSKVIFSSNDGTPLAGNATVTFSAGIPTVAAVENGSTTITVNVSGAGTYYVAVLPCQYKRLKDGRFVTDYNSRLHYLLTVQPDTTMSAYDFWRQAVQAILLEGNAYIVPIYSPVTMEIDRLVLCGRGTVSHDTINDQYTVTDTVNGVFGVYEENEIIHFKGMSMDGKTGVSVLTYARLTSRIATTGDNETLNRFANGGNVSMRVPGAGPDGADAFLTSMFNPKVTQYLRVTGFETKCDGAAAIVMMPTEMAVARGLDHKVIDLLGTCYVTDKHVISVQTDRGTPYNIYFQVQNELVAAYNELRDDLAIAKFGHPYARCSEDEQVAVRTYYPQKISEAEPKNYGGN